MVVVALGPEADNHHGSYAEGEKRNGWNDMDLEPPAGADVLFASGAPFEISTEPVLGVECKAQEPTREHS